MISDGGEGKTGGRLGRREARELFRSGSETPRRYTNVLEGGGGGRRYLLSDDFHFQSALESTEMTR